MATARATPTIRARRLEHAGGIQVIDCAGPHGLYVYERGDGTRFGMWDARRPAPGQALMVPVHVDDGVGGGHFHAATLVAMSHTGNPNYWRTDLKAGEDRVFVAMTPTMARVHAAEQWEVQSPETQDEMKRRYASYEEMIEGCAAQFLELDLPDLVMVTGGMLQALALDPPDEASGYQAVPDEVVSTSVDQAVSVAREVSNELNGFTYRCRHGDTLTFAEWERLQARGLEYATVAHSTVPLVGPFELEVITGWMGVVVDGDDSKVFMTMVRVRHTCGRESCANSYAPMFYAPNELLAEAQHAVAARLFDDTTGPAGRSLLAAVGTIAERMKARGWEHPPAQLWEAMNRHAMRDLETQAPKPKRNPQA